MSGAGPPDGEARPAGRDLDALVAEKVMGLRIVADEYATPGYLQIAEEGKPWYELPHYSTDIAAAWEVVGKLRETCWASVDGIGRPDPVWRAEFRAMSDPVTGMEAHAPVSQIAPTAPLAICLAALKVVGVSDEVKYRYRHRPNV
jgi:hypothetical protein